MYISNEYKNITYKFTVARQKINAETTHEFFTRTPPTFFTFFNFTSDVHNKNQHLPPNSHWTITAALPRINHIRINEKNITHNDYQLSTKSIQRKRIEIMKMMVSWKQKEILRKIVYSKSSCVVFYN